MDKFQPFEGTSQLGEARAIILRSMDHSSLKIHQRLVCMQLLVKSLAGEEVTRQLLSQSIELCQATF